jgi:hypothetical protein
MSGLITSERNYAKQFVDLWYEEQEECLRNVLAVFDVLLHFTIWATRLPHSGDTVVN